MDRKVPLLVPKSFLVKFDNICLKRQRKCVNLFPLSCKLSNIVYKLIRQFHISIIFNPSQLIFPLSLKIFVFKFTSKSCSVVYLILTNTSRENQTVLAMKQMITILKKREKR